MRCLRLYFIDSPGGGHLVGIGWASGEVCISLSILLNGALGILVPCWWWLVWTFAGVSFWCASGNLFCEGFAGVGFGWASIDLLLLVDFW